MWYWSLISKVCAAFPENNKTNKKNADEILAMVYTTLASLKNLFIYFKSKINGNQGMSG